jgi:hypothetical protein
MMYGACGRIGTKKFEGGASSVSVAVIKHESACPGTARAEASNKQPFNVPRRGRTGEEFLHSFMRLSHAVLGATSQPTTEASFPRLSATIVSNSGGMTISYSTN